MSGLIDLASFDDAALAAIGAGGGGGGQSLTRTAVKTSAYTASSGDLIPVDTTAGSVTVTLPTAPADKAKVAVKHIIQGGTNTVSVACGGSDVLNKSGGNTSATLSLVNQGATYEYQAATHIWTVTAGDLPLSGLDLRYPKTAGGNTLTGTWDFTGATLSGVSGGTGTATAITQTAQSGTTYTLVLADAGTLVEFTNAAGNTLTVPPNSSVAFPTGTFISLRQYGTGQVTVVAGAGVTVRSRGLAYKTGGQYAEATLTKRATDEWVLTGDVSV